ncbi:unnamed protein product [Cyclocybe aegerita]|uniref:DNA polymerase n=1 Tax=Cyclocybe aegerita TaxID=1973307 RepID=A0A8S0WLT8_CYCAE|nr:unnamed protein product [Cyclocybe aegerita]
MPAKRPLAVTRSRSYSSSSERSRKRFRSSSLAGSLDNDDGNSPLKVYIVQAKIDQDELLELFSFVENQGNEEPTGFEQRLQLELCSDFKDANIIITKVRMRKRLERHIDWGIAKQKAIVTPDWLRESVKQGHPVECGAYAALGELHEETVEHCPEAEAPSDDASATMVSSSRPPSPIAYKVSSVKPTHPRVFKNWKSRYACARASPLVCVNQQLAEELDVLRRSRELEGLRVNALSYERSVAIIKCKFLRHSLYSEPHEETTRESERFQSLSTFASIYGIGPVKARKLYDLGLRTIEDLERYYDVPAGLTANDLPELQETALLTPNGNRIPQPLMSSAKGKGKDVKLPDMSVKIALVLREDLTTPIPREEVEEMHRVVMKVLEEIQPGCVSTIVGGYRRGKPQSNDADIIISHSDLKSGAGLVKGLCTKLTQRLYAKGLVTHLMHLSGFHAHNALKTGHWDSLEKALTVFVLQSNGKQRRIHRRLDLIFAAPEAYWTAVIGWSGSRMFERDLRLWAKQEKGMKFDSSGLTRRHDSRLYIPRSEQEVFDILSLDWVDPTMRNANA